MANKYVAAPLDLAVQGWVFFKIIVPGGRLINVLLRFGSCFQLTVLLRSFFPEKLSSVICGVFRSVEIMWNGELYQDKITRLKMGLLFDKLFVVII